MMKLSVQSGPQAGAVETLATGRWLVGSGDHCDLVLRDAGIQNEHLMLVIADDGDDGVRIHFLSQSQSQGQSKSQSQSKLQSQSPRDVETLRPAPNSGEPWGAGQPLRLGSTTLLWAPVASTELRALEPSERVQPTLRFEPIDRFGRSVTWVLGGLAGCLVAGVLAVQANRANAGALGIEAHASATLSAQEVLLAKLADLKLPELGVLRKPDGSATITGWVQGAAEMNTVRQFLSGSNIRTAIIEAAEQVRFAREYLLTRGLVTAISYQGEGVLRLQARGQDPTGFRAVVLDLEKAAPQVRRFEVDYEEQTVTPPAASAAPAAAPLPPTPRPVIAGIDGVSLSSRQRFLTAGQHYFFEGGRLKDGSTLLSIEQNQLGLKVDARSTPYKITAGDEP